MPQFFFHVRKAQTVFEDKRGGDFADIKAAWNWAEADARAMLRDGEIEGPIDHLWIEICDRTQTLVATLPFVRVIN
jgi:hypothetical protein